MEKYGEYLYEAISPNLKESIENLSEEDIEDCCEYKIFDRGLGYYENGLVSEINFNTATNIITARVKGTSKYYVEILVCVGKVKKTAGFL